MSTGSVPTPRRVLISNDDGPPGKESPYVFGLYMALTRDLGWDVKVVIPSSQKSWIGKAYQIQDIIKGVYYYPKAPDGQGSISPVSRPLEEGEVGEWILFDGTPATCTNIALHNLYPGEIDLVISGPNYGRNTSSAFSLSSGTIGAALSACLSRTRAVAVSYGTFRGINHVALSDPAHELAIRILKKLWEDWGKDTEGLRNEEVDLYNVNLPMIEELRQPGGLEVVWTRVWRNNYGQLFKPKEEGRPSSRVQAAGPDAGSETPVTVNGSSDELPATSGQLLFQFFPKMDSLVNPPVDTLAHGTDAWAIHSARASVTPLRAAFAEPLLESYCFESEKHSDEEKLAGRVFKL